MATVEIISYSDDLTGEVGDDVKPRSIGWLGNHYEIDLSEAHTKEIDDFLAPYIENARIPKPQPKPRKKSKYKPTSREYKAYLFDVRNWARQNGMKINPRGRIPRQVLEAYEAEHK